MSVAGQPLCINHLRALWITTTSQSTCLYLTREVWVFPTLLPYQLLHALICPAYLSQTSTSYHFQNSDACAGKTKNISLADLKLQLKWETFVHITLRRPSELMAAIHRCHPHHPECGMLSKGLHFTTPHNAFHSATQPKTSQEPQWEIQTISASIVQANSSRCCASVRNSLCNSHSASSSPALNWQQHRIC